MVNDGTADGRRAEWRRRGCAVMSFKGHPHRIDLAAIERRYFDGVVAGKYTGRDSLAEACGISRSTVSRFFQGRSCSIRVVLALLSELTIKFDDAATPLEPE